MLPLSGGRETPVMLLLSEGKFTLEFNLVSASEPPSVAVEPDEEKVNDDTVNDLMRNVRVFFSSNLCRKLHNFDGNGTC